MRRTTLFTLAFSGLYLLLVLSACSTSRPAPSPAPEPTPPAVEKPLRGFPCELLGESDEAYAQCLKDNAQAPRADWDGATYVEKGTKKKVQVPAAEYTEILGRALWEHGRDLLTRPSIADSATWCPNFSSLDRAGRLRFFVVLISAMARHESGFDPLVTYGEAFADAKGKQVISRGLLQLSQESANNPRYGCAIGQAEQLHDAPTNLVCGVKILNALVKENGYLGSELGSDQRSDFRGGSRYWSVLRKLLLKEGKWIQRPAWADITKKAKEACK